MSKLDELLEQNVREHAEVAQPEYEIGLTAGLAHCLEHIGDHPNDRSAVVRLGTIKLESGEVAEIQLFVTAESDIFVEAMACPERPLLTEAANPNTGIRT